MFLCNSSVEVSIWRWCVHVLDHESMKWVSQGSQTIWQSSMQNQVAYV
jgi:hypothetical protein